MKKILQSLLMVLFLTISFSFEAMSRLLRAKSSLGRTHFIHGASARYYSTKQSSEKKNSSLQASSLINDSNVGPSYETCEVRCLFSKKHDIQSTLVSLLNEAETSIHAAFFSFTNPSISKALINAHKRGVKVSLILDPTTMKTHYCKGQDLIKNKIPVYRFNPNNDPNHKYESLMHHKFIVIDGEKVITGSANSTRSAYKYNRENTIILKSPTLALLFRDEFKDLKKSCDQCLQ